MLPQEQLIFFLALHLGGCFYEEPYQNEKNIEKLANILLGSKLKKKMEQAQQVYQTQQKKNIHTLSFFDQNYPPLLKNIHKPPFVLFCLGNLKLLQNRKLSMVGTRSPSVAGIKAAEFISNHLSGEKKITIVSGMAHGIDTACHRSSYQNSGGSIGVLAHGLDYIYPKSNYDLYEQVQKKDKANLLFISEYPVGIKPRRYHFPQRNRIISGLSSSLFFIEGGLKSGALITCRYALEQNRDIYALDHSLLQNNEGGQSLISQGALPLSKYYSISITDKKTNTTILERIQSQHSFYFGNYLWVYFEARQMETARFISSADA